MINNGLIISLFYSAVQGEIMKEDREENMENHDNLVQPVSNSSSSSPESHWEEGQEVIPTFFSTMNTRYSVLSDVTEGGCPLGGPPWGSFQMMVCSSRIENLC